MSAFCEDLTRRDFYVSSSGFSLPDEHLDLDVFEWTRGSQGVQNVRLSHVADLSSRPKCNLRIIFTELDLPDHRIVKGLMALFDYYSFPSAFLSERLQSVTHSFGSRQIESGGEHSWFHFLCKNINVEYRKDRHGADIAEIVNQNVRPEAIFLRQADFSWIRSGYFLKSEPLKATTKAKTKANADLTGVANPNQSVPGSENVTLVCFGAPISLRRRIERLASSEAWEDVLHDPYILFDIVADELYLQLDRIAWSLGEVFGGIEGRVLSRATKPGEAAEYIDFVGMHNVAKHITYLREAADAAILTMESLQSYHRHARSEHHSALRTATQNALRYRKGLFQSTQLRLASMDKRMQNIISLSFNLVTQHDSRIMQRDSSSMKTIAILTLLFLPGSTVATVFGSQFFDFAVNPDGSMEFSISPFFWVFWVVTIPVTIMVVIMWRWHFRRATSQFMSATQPMGRKSSAWSMT